MKLVLAHGLRGLQGELIREIEHFVHSWRKQDDNGSYSTAVFYGVLIENTHVFREVDEDETTGTKNILYHIKCSVQRGGEVIYVSLML